MLEAYFSILEAPFHYDIKCLGHIVSRDCICEDAEKISVVEDWPVARFYRGLRVDFPELRREKIPCTQMAKLPQVEDGWLNYPTLTLIFRSCIVLSRKKVIADLLLRSPQVQCHAITSDVVDVTCHQHSAFA